jgi:hypothetical protein
LYFKSNCMAAILFQKNLLPFHVSGVIDPDGGVWLFSATTGTGKSTTALKLQERGFRLFTDDTALIYVQNGVCYSKASYPMLKAWQETLDKQSKYLRSESFQLHSSIKKYGILFHQEFTKHPIRVKGIIFLEKDGESIQIHPITAVQGLGKLLENIYRGEWVSVLKKHQLQFETVTEIAKTLPFWTAKRPVDQDSFESFAAAIEEFIICPPTKETLNLQAS